MKADLNIISNFSTAYTEIQKSFFQMLPNLASAFLALLAGIALAYALKWVTVFLVRSILKLIPRQLPGNEAVKDNTQSIAKGMGGIVFFVILFLAGVSVLKRLGLLVISDWLEGLSLHLPKVVLAITVVTLGWKLKSFTADVLFKTFARSRLVQAKVLSNVLGWFVFSVGLIIALEQIGVEMGLVVTVIAVLGGVITGGVALTFALGAKTTVSNILSCHQVKRHVKIGQRLKHLNVEGTVKSVGPTFVLVSTKNEDVILAGNSFYQNATSVADGE